VFVLINLVQIYRLLAERRALKSMKDVHLLRQGAFADLDDRELARLVKAGSWRDFEEGVKITSEGEPVSELVLICEGEAVVNVDDQIVTRLSRGALVGEMAFVSGHPASATVVTSSPTRAFAFDMAKLRGFVRTDELIAAALHRVIGRDLTQKLAQQH